MSIIREKKMIIGTEREYWWKMLQATNNVNYIVIYFALEVSGWPNFSDTTQRLTYIYKGFI